MSDANELSDKHKQFVNEYLKRWNATEAYMAAYPKANRASAGVLGSSLLANSDIRAAIDERMMEMAMGTDEILVRLAEYARGNYLPFIKIEKGLIYFDLTDPKAIEHFHLIKKINKIRVKTPVPPTAKAPKKTAEPTEERWVEVELHDPLRALELLGKAHKLFVYRHELTGKDGAPLGERAELTLKDLAPYISDEDLEILDHASQIMVRATQQYEDDQPPAPPRAPYIGRRSKPSDYPPG
jgi:hypothetical protein